jgi:hypothetical protein
MFLPATVVRPVSRRKVSRRFTQSLEDTSDSPTIHSPSPLIVSVAHSDSETDSSPLKSNGSSNHPQLERPMAMVSPNIYTIYSVANRL